MSAQGKHRQRRFTSRLGVNWLAGLLMTLFIAWPVQADRAWDAVRARPQLDQGTIAVPINKSRVIELPVPAIRISLGNPAIADILSINERQIYINGKELGTTNMILWGEGDRVRRQIGLEVTHDLQTLKAKFHQFMPKEEIRVSSANSAIVLSGEVSSPSRLDAALRLAESFARQEEGYGGLGSLTDSNDSKATRVINLLRVGGAQQVLLEVRVAEVSRSLSKQMGVDFRTFYDGGSVTIGVVSDFASNPGFELETLIGGNFPEITGLALDIAQSQGLARILAEPNLTTLSGQQAEFISGGQFPIITFNEDGLPSTDFKNYGIELRFLPIVLDSDLISLQVNVSVSELGDNVQTAVGPVASTRRRGASSTVEVPSGQTISIAGLLSENITSSGNRYPGIGDIPILGNLFRGQSFLKRQTELVIFVTPRLARSYSPDLVKLPTQDFVDPSDVEFYLQGRLYGSPGRDQSGNSKGQGKGRLGPDKSGSEGPFGHDL